MPDDLPGASPPDGAGYGAVDDAGREALLAAVFFRARRNVARRISVLVAMTDPRADGALPATARDAARREAHTLIGTAGTFGLDVICELARELEQVLRHDTGQDRRRAGQLVRQMAAALPPGADGDQPGKPAVDDA